MFETMINAWKTVSGISPAKDCIGPQVLAFCRNNKITVILLYSGLDFFVKHR